MPSTWPVTFRLKGTGIVCCVYLPHDPKICRRIIGKLLDRGMMTKKDHRKIGWVLDGCTKERKP